MPRSSALLGMQAQYEHSPPTSSLSTSDGGEPALDDDVGDVLAGRAGAEDDDVVGLLRCAGHRPILAGVVD